MPPDFVDLLRAFVDADVRFLIVGAHALAIHGRPRATGDLDVWVDATPDNAERVIDALRRFGAPLEQVSTTDFARPGITYQIGVPPFRIDLLTELSGIAFSDVWPDRVAHRVEDVPVSARSGQAPLGRARLSAPHYVDSLPKTPSGTIQRFVPRKRLS